ncbi:flagellar hook protein FlgE [Anaerospora hongkongensis]|uniref:flagellar hook protein FlgE n=1 Tax=Anaerospora hongkongensis TaxID=244830 RepID=UPI00289FFCC7|nr:flagellar hook protein FlgE [Anaerospora hongkongensis]
MMRSLYAGVSGLRNHQTRMDVIGNNIANVNTVGYKGSRVTFQDVLSQTVRGASAGNGARGGTNPMQVGLGMGVASIDTLFTDGSFQPTGKPTDLSIQGAGFFILTDGTNQLYTRAGNFDFDNEGNYLVPGTGFRVAGWVADESGVVNANGPVTGIKIPVGVTMAAKVSTQTTSAGNLSADAPVGTVVQAPVELYDSLGIAHKMNTTYYKIDNTTWLSKTTVSDASITADTQWQQITFNTNGSFKEAVTIEPPDPTASSLDIPSFKMDKTPNAVHTANHTIFDANGTPHAVSMTFTTNAAGDGWTYKISESGVKNPVVVEGTMGWNGTAYTGITDPIAVSVGGTNYSFDIGTQDDPTVGPAVFNAALDDTTYTAKTTLDNFNITPTTGATPMSIKANLNAITSYAGESTVQVEKDGYGAGTLDSKYIDTTGVIVGNFTNGQSKVLGQVALATFNNPSGLNKAGDNLFTKSVNSGEAKVGTAGSGGRGTFNPGNLEMSNVDLAQEFSNMIITQRGFQANSKIITTTDQMLEELANLKR